MGKSRERRRKAANMLLFVEGIRNLFVVVVCWFWSTESEWSLISDAPLAWLNLIFGKDFTAVSRINVILPKILMKIIISKII